MLNRGFHRRYENEKLDEAQQAALNWRPRYEWKYPLPPSQGALTEEASEAQAAVDAQAPPLPPILRYVADHPGSLTCIIEEGQEMRFELNAPPEEIARWGMSEEAIKAWLTQCQARFLEFGQRMFAPTEPGAPLTLTFTAEAQQARDERDDARMEHIMRDAPLRFHGGG